MTKVYITEIEIPLLKIILCGCILQIFNKEN